MEGSQVQPGLYSEFWASLSYVMRLCFKPPIYIYIYIHIFLTIAI